MAGFEPASLLLPGRRCVFSTVVGLIAAFALAAAAEGPPKNEQAMATTPEELVELLSDVSFLPPEEFEARISAAAAEHVFPFGLGGLIAVTMPAPLVSRME